MRRRSSGTIHFDFFLTFVDLISVSLCFFGLLHICPERINGEMKLIRKFCSHFKINTKLFFLVSGTINMRQSAHKGKNFDVLDCF